MNEMQMNYRFVRKGKWRQIKPTGVTLYNDTKHSQITRQSDVRSLAEIDENDSNWTKKERFAIDLLRWRKCIRKRVKIIYRQ